MYELNKNFLDLLQVFAQTGSQLASQGLATTGSSAVIVLLESAEPYSEICFRHQACLTFALASPYS